MEAEIIQLGVISSLLAGLATGAGALPVLFTRRISDRLLDVMLGFSAGVMLAATSFSLIIPAIELSGPWVAVFGIVLGAFVLHLVDRLVPHFHPLLGAEGPSSKLPRVWLFPLIFPRPRPLPVLVSPGRFRVLSQAARLAREQWRSALSLGLVTALLPTPVDPG